MCQRIVVIGRLAIFPSALLASAAGASDMPSKEFLPADLIGGLASIAEVIGAGYFFGAAYHEAGPWLTGIGIAMLAVLLIVAGRALARV
jgi:membrane protein DedA with SNARE-associated domain